MGTNNRLEQQDVNDVFKQLVVLAFLIALTTVSYLCGVKNGKDEIESRAGKEIDKGCLTVAEHQRIECIVFGEIQE